MDDTRMLDYASPRAGRRKGKATPKGRQLDPVALREVQALLGTRARQRDLLIEHLHALQDEFGCLHDRHLTALADEMRLALAEIYEVASFYAHFDIVRTGEPAPPPLTIRVCDSLTCALSGAEALLARLAQSVGPNVRVVRAPCVGRCNVAPTAEVGHRYVDHATVESVAAACRAGHVDPEIPVHQSFDAYVAGGGYGWLQRCRNGTASVDSVLAALDQAGLRGLGGAGFPTARKWRSVRGEPGPRLMAVNGDEGEPGTFKDRHFLETEPHCFIEGMLIAAWAVEAEAIYVYIRDEYPAARRILERELAHVAAAGLMDGTAVHLRRGAGAYICGEESAMLESIEGKRGLPRHKPPFPFQVGLFGRPTLINNIETLFWVRHILETGQPPLRSYSVSGRVKDPGVKIVAPGVTARQLIEEHCGGMLEGHRFKAYLPGGASGGILPASLADLPLDFGKLEPHGCFVGSHAVVILSDQDDMKAAALNLMRFFEDESCGQCTPCRAGTEKAVKLMQHRRWDEALLDELSGVMRDASICGLGQAAPNPLVSVLKHFRDEVLG